MHGEIIENKLLKLNPAVTLRSIVSILAWLRQYNGSRRQESVPDEQKQADNKRRDRKFIFCHSYGKLEGRS